MIAAHGVAGVTHRAVTEAAGVPLATVSYFFDSIDDLTTEAIRTFTARRVEELHTRVEQSADSSVPGALVNQTVADNRLSDRAQILAMFESYLYAAREPSMRDLVTDMLGSFEALAATTLRIAGAPSPEPIARSFVALVDGYSLHSMASDRQQVQTAELNDALSAMFLGYLLQQGHTEQAINMAADRRK
ncbi:Transcriptional regulator, TetR [Rhodococcus sp. B7740]|nr:Transcriptional regulator, TetR [Rhodococcus sp. B7740]